MIHFFLQASATDKVTAVSLIMKGGWVMLPIVILFVGAIYLMVFKYLNFKRLGHVNERLLDSVLEALKKGDKENAMRLCATDTSMLGRILERGIIRLGSPIQEVEGGMESSAKAAINKLEKGMGVLSSIATLAPMFGFVGTVIGMIAIFSDIAASGDVLSISTIANGMYIKMVSSAAGLAVGILAHVFNTYLNTMLDRILTQLEEASNRFIDTLYTA